MYQADASDQFVFEGKLLTLGHGIKIQSRLPIPFASLNVPLIIINEWHGIFDHCRALYERNDMYLILYGANLCRLSQFNYACNLASGATMVLAIPLSV